MTYSKIPSFQLLQTGLTSKWDRISIVLEPVQLHDAILWDIIVGSLKITAYFHFQKTRKDVQKSSYWLREGHPRRSTYLLLNNQRPKDYLRYTDTLKINILSGTALLQKYKNI